MIIQHNERGGIWHKINDPVNEGLIPALQAAGQSFLNFPPVPKPPVPTPRLDIEGQPVLDEEGQPIIDMVSPGFDYVACDPELDYIVDGQITPRPQFDIGIPELLEFPADGAVHYYFYVPDPCECIVDGETVVVTGGVLELSSDMPAEYEIRLVQHPYVEKKFTVIAHAPE